MSGDVFSDVLGIDVTARSFFGSDIRVARAKYMKYMHLVHPDVSKDPRASKAASRLNELWQLYTHPSEDMGIGTHASAAGSTIRPQVKFKTADKAFLIDPHGNRWLVLNRTAGVLVKTPLSPDIIAKMQKLTSGTPLVVCGIVEQAAVRQRDGIHNGFYAQPVRDKVQALYSVSSLIKHVRSKGILNGRDVAWMFKRILFLSGVLTEVGVTKSSLMGELAVDPEYHTISVVDTTGFSPVSSVDNTARLAKDFYSLVKGADIDGRVLAFIRGCQYHTDFSAGDLIREFDGVLRDVYGPPSFHKMAL